MERLTTKNIAGVAVYKHPFECERCGETIWRLPDYGDGSPTEKLADYEDADEQGLLLRLPCKVGDTVWRIFLSDNYIMPCNVEECVYSDSLYIIVREELFNTRRGLNINEIGKTVFLTKAEAEKKLKGIGGENEID